MPSLICSTQRFAVEATLEHDHRCVYVCPLCGGTGCIDNFSKPVTWEGRTAFDLSPTCIESSGKHMRLVVPSTGFDAPYIEVSLV